MTPTRIRTATEPTLSIFKGNWPCGPSTGVGGGQPRSKIKSILEYSWVYPPQNPSQNRPQTHDFRREIAVRTLPRTPSNGNGTKNKMTNILEHSWVFAISLI